MSNIMESFFRFVELSFKKLKHQKRFEQKIFSLTLKHDALYNN